MLKRRLDDFSQDQVLSRLRQFRIFVSYFDEPHFDQFLQIPWGDGRQLPALGADVAEDPTQGNRFFKTEVSERVVSHCMTSDVDDRGFEVAALRQTSSDPHWTALPLPVGTIDCVKEDMRITETRTELNRNSSIAEQPPCYLTLFQDESSQASGGFGFGK